MTQQEEGRQLTESIELSGPLDQRIKKVLKAKDEAPSLVSYPSSESLQEFESDEINAEQYWYYTVKAEQIKKKMIKQQELSLRGMNTIKIPNSMIAFMLNIQSKLRDFNINLR